ncbi:MAG: metal ABC transporter substrate-binding protein [Candidatus Nezhaarchaeales archaeon]
MKSYFLLLIVAAISLLFIMSPYVLMTYASSVKQPLVIVTISPLYLIAKEVIGDKAEIHVLAPAGVDPHHYSPTPRDRLLIESCDLFISIGREEFLGALPRPKGRELSWNDWITEAHIENDNPHYLWLYPDNAKLIAKKIAKVMSELDPLNSDYYENRIRGFDDRLEALKLWLQGIDEVVRKLGGKGLKGREVVLAADHFEPLVKWLELNITYVIVKGEGLPGPRDVSEAIGKAKLSPLIIVSATQSEGDEGRIARLVSEASGARIAYLYGVPMSMDDDYISFIKRNVMIVAAHFVEHLPVMSSTSTSIDVFVVSTIILTVIVIVQTILIWRLRAR